MRANMTPESTVAVSQRARLVPLETEISRNGYTGIEKIKPNRYISLAEFQNSNNPMNE